MCCVCFVLRQQITSAKGMLNMCGLSSSMPALSAKLDVYMLTLCSAMEDLARNEKEDVQVGKGRLHVACPREWFLLLHGRSWCVCFLSTVTIVYHQRPPCAVSAAAHTFEDTRTREC